MPLTNAEIEQLWIDGWEELYQALQREPAALADDHYRELTLEEAQALIQRSATARLRVRLARTWARGRPALRLDFISAE